MKQSMNRGWLVHFAIVGLIFSMLPRANAQGKLPEPDFSVMSQWYDVVKWTYDDAGSITIVVRPKNAAPQTHRLFTMVYLDSDGVKIGGPAQFIGLGYNTPAGDTERAEAPAPAESQLKKIKRVAVYRILDDGSLVGPAVAKPQPRPGLAPPKAGNPGSPKASVPVQHQDSDCFADKQPPSSARTPFSPALIKSLLYERYSFEANTGGLTSPLAIGVKYLSIEPGRSYINTVTVAPGRGAQRKQDGAPPNATIYPFKAKYIVCRKYAKEVTQTQYESDFVCFKAKNGNWDCPVDGVPKITHLN